MGPTWQQPLVPKDEYWATFSIYDHRTPRYRQALVLFDRIVVPVPKAPVGDITEEEALRIEADVRYLVEHEAAVESYFDPAEFEKWRGLRLHAVGREALTQRLAGGAKGHTDLQWMTRVHEAEKALRLELPAGVATATPVPVYGSRDEMGQVMQQEAYPGDAVWLALSHYIPAPDDSVELEAIVALRSSPGFQSTVSSLRRWHDKILPEVLADPTGKRLRAALRDFVRWTDEYRAKVHAAGMSRTRALISPLITLGKLLVAPALTMVEILVGAAEGATELKIEELRQPAWRQVADEECAAAGIVIEIERAMVVQSALHTAPAKHVKPDQSRPAR
jgi:hypothetical protein